MLQDLLPDPYLLLGLDTCFGMVPARWAGGSDGVYRHLGFAYEQLPDDGGHPMPAVRYGDVGRRMTTGFHRGDPPLVARSRVTG
ncbi:hypothetical protein Q5530_37080 [Saccharothrix sp. BKS2]|uniref:hypothetical protein n=1 Tax=Saccharothrix sp. BKS2 TaxID=3064400 RepID=UPI0039EAC418